MVDDLSKKSPDQGVNVLRSLCGLPLTTYFSAVKLKWLLDNVPNVSKARDENRLSFGTMDTWLIYVRKCIYIMYN